MKPLILIMWSVMCITIGVLLLPTCQLLQNTFLTSSGVGLASHDAGPVLFDDPNDIRYWPSIDELQWFGKTKRDGLFRKNSQDDYEARRWVWYGNQNAMILWPEDASGN